jgi:hypothetical protein
MNLEPCVGLDPRKCNGIVKILRIALVNLQQNEGLNLYMQLTDVEKNQPTQAFGLVKKNQESTRTSEKDWSTDLEFFLKPGEEIVFHLKRNMQVKAVGALFVISQLPDRDHPIYYAELFGVNEAFPTRPTLKESKLYHNPYKSLFSFKGKKALLSPLKNFSNLSDNDSANNSSRTQDNFNFTDTQFLFPNIDLHKGTNLLSLSFLEMKFYSRGAILGKPAALYRCSGLNSEGVNLIANRVLRIDIYNPTNNVKIIVVEIRDPDTKKTSEDIEINYSFIHRRPYFCEKIIVHIPPQQNRTLLIRRRRKIKDKISAVFLLEGKIYHTDIVAQRIFCANLLSLPGRLPKCFEVAKKIIAPEVLHNPYICEIGCPMKDVLNVSNTSKCLTKEDSDSQVFEKTSFSIDPLEQFIQSPREDGFLSSPNYFEGIIAQIRNGAELESE